MNQLLREFKDLLKISFVKDVTILEIGTIISTGLAALASIVFARVLGPEKYGIYSLIFALVGLIGIFMNVGAEHVILTLLPAAYAKKDKQEIKNILTYFIKIYLFIALTLGLISIIFAPLISDLLYHNSQIGQLARWILLANIFALFFLLLTLSLQSIRQIRNLSILEVLNKLFYKLIPIIFVLFGFGLLGLVLGYFLVAILFLIFSLLAYSYLAYQDEYLPTLKAIFFNFKKIKLKKYFNFGLLIALDKNLARVYTLVPVIFLGMFVSTQEVGFFKIAFGYMTMPLLLLRPISRLLAVQLPKSKVYGIRQLRTHFFKTALYSGLLSLASVILFIIAAPFLIKLFYGSSYQASIPLVYALAIYPVVSAFGVGLGPIFRTLNRMKTAILINLSLIIIGLPIIFYLIKKYLSMGVIAGTIGWTFFSILIAFIFINKYLKEEDKSERTNLSY